MPHGSETHSVEPLHPSTSSFTCSQMYFSLSHLQPSSWSAHFPSLPPSLSPPRCSPCRVTVSSHSINQACEGSWTAQCSIASHSPRLLPSVPVSLTVTVRRGGGLCCQIRSAPPPLPSSRPPHQHQPPLVAGQEMGRMLQEFQIQPI